MLTNNALHNGRLNFQGVLRITRLRDAQQLYLNYYTNFSIECPTGPEMTVASYNFWLPEAYNHHKTPPNYHAYSNYVVPPTTTNTNLCRLRYFFRNQIQETDLIPQLHLYNSSKIMPIGLFEPLTNHLV